MADTKYAVKLRRTVVEEAIVTVEAPNQRNAAFSAGQMQPEWGPVSTKVEVDSVDGADDA